MCKRCGCEIFIENFNIEAEQNVILQTIYLKPDGVLDIDMMYLYS